jgi:benzoate-CoA ligase family protein
LTTNERENEGPSRVQAATMVIECYNAATLIDDALRAGWGSRTAVLFGDERITYDDLQRRICAMGLALRARGVGREQRVLLVLGDTPAFPVTFFGAMRIGAVPVPVNPAYKPADYRFFLEDSRAGLVVTEAAFLDNLKPALDGYTERVQIVLAESFPELLAAHEGELPPAETHRDDIALWLYSSGSTGRPKGVVHLHRDIAATCETYSKQILQLTERDVVFGRVLFHAYGLGNALTFPFHAGASSILVPGRPTPQGLLDVIRRARPTVLCLVPTLYQAILNEPSATARDLASVRLCISAAEPLAPETWRQWRDRFGLKILDGIGSTEMLHIFCSNTVKDCRPGSSGKAVPGYELRLVDDDGREVLAGETGNLLVKGSSASPFYWHQRDKSRQTMLGEWVATGDRYRRDDEGFYWYEGRADDMLKVGGEWVSPIAIENTLLEHELVREVAVVGVGVAGIMRIRAVIILKSQQVVIPDVKRELQEWCKSRLQRYQYPHFIDFVDDLPKTASGKIERYKLRQGFEV